VLAGLEPLAATPWGKHFFEKIDYRAVLERYPLPLPLRLSALPSGWYGLDSLSEQGASSADVTYFDGQRNPLFRDRITVSQT
jgi:hypothetical protein